MKNSDIESYIKEGQKIKCINSEGQKILKLGSIYTVMKKDTSGRVYIQEHKRFSFLVSRFEVINE